MGHGEGGEACLVNQIQQGYSLATFESLPETSLGKGALGSTAGEDSAFVLDPQYSDRIQAPGPQELDAEGAQRPGRFQVAQVRCTEREAWDRRTSG